MAVMKYKDPVTNTWIPIGIPGVTAHDDLTGLDIGDDHPQYLLKGGGTMTGELVILEPALPQHPTTKSYVDARLGAYVQPDDPGNPSTAPAGIRGALWVDTDDGALGSEYLPLTGGTILGNLVVTGMLEAQSAASGVTGFRRITVSLDPPPAGSGRDGDIWFQRIT